MEHKELLKVQWDWQIGKTVFALLVRSDNLISAGSHCIIEPDRSIGHVS